VFDDFDRDNEIVTLGELVGDRAVRAERLDLFGHVRDRVGRQIDAAGVDAASAQRLNQDSDRAIRIQHALRLNRRDDLVGDAAEKAQPVRITLVGHAAAVRHTLLL
jgi:hypothetical protein